MSLNENDIRDHTRFMLCEFNDCFNSEWDFDDCAQYWKNTLKALREYRKSLRTIAEYDTFLKQTELLLKRVEELQVRRTAPDQEITSELIRDMTQHQALVRNIGTVRRVWQTELSDLKARRRRRTRTPIHLGHGSNTFLGETRVTQN